MRPVLTIKKIIPRNLDSYQIKALELCAKIQKAAPNTFVAGGAVRDMLIGRKAFDVDIATELSPYDTRKFLKAVSIKSYSIGEKFGTIGALIEGRLVEITTFRQESEYSDYRHPKKVTFIKDPVKDVVRRDITINALLYDPSKTEVIDYVGGLKDLKSKSIKFVGDADQRIKEDPLRMIRAVRFATALRFNIAPKSAAAIRKNAALIKKISGERIKSELDKIFSNENYVNGLKLLDKSGLLKEILPEITRLKIVKQSKDFHAEGNVFVHTVKVLQNAKDGDLVFRYAVLFHDLGKYGTRIMKIQAGRPHTSFTKHGPVGAEMFLQIAKRLRFSRAERLHIHYLIYNHMKLLFPEQISEQSLLKMAESRYFPDLVKLRIADSLGAIATDKTGKRIKKDPHKWMTLLEKYEQWKQISMNNFVSGKDVIRILKIPTGEKIGKILNEIKIMRFQGKIVNRKDALRYLQKIKPKN